MITRPAATPIIMSICLVLSNSRKMNKIRASPNNTILHSHEFLFGIMFLSTYELTNLHQCFLCFLVHCVFSFRTFIFSDEKKTLSPEIMFPKKVSRKSISYSNYFVSTSKNGKTRIKSSARNRKNGTITKNHLLSNRCQIDVICHSKELLLRKHPTHLPACLFPPTAFL